MHQPRNEEAPEEKKKKGLFALLKGSAPKTESDAEYYARRDRERKEREEARAKQLKEERELREAKKKADDERRKKEEEERQAERDRREALRIESKLRMEKLQEEMDRQLELHKAENKRQLEEMRNQQLEDEKRAREEREAESERRLREEEARQERQRLQKEAEEREAAQRRERELRQLEEQNARAASQLSAATSTAAASGRAQTQALMAALAVETAAERALRLDTDRLERELEEKAKAEREKTAALVRSVDESRILAEQELQRRSELRLADHLQREEQWARMEAEYRATAAREGDRKRVEEQVFADRYAEEMAELRASAASAERQRREETAQARYDHELNMNRIAEEARAQAAEMNRRMREREEQRRQQWNAMMRAFAEMMHGQRAAEMNKESERMWDERFNQMRRAFDPAGEVLTQLQLTPLDHKEPEKSRIQVEGLLESLGITLDTIQNIIDSEREQVAEWKLHQPDAHFLHDYAIALDTIVGRLAAVRDEEGGVTEQVRQLNRRPSGAPEILDLEPLECRMTALRDGFNAIPSVYELNKRYAPEMRARLESNF